MMKKKLTRRIASLILMSALAIIVLSCGSRPPPDAFQEIDQAVSRNDFNAAIAAIVAGQENERRPLYPEKNAVALFLDKGFLEHYAENFRQSSEDLLNAERLIDEAFTKSITQNFMSYIANDNTKDYPGEDFEDIYLSIFNALNFFRMENTDGALVEVRKLTNQNGKLDMLSRKHENARGSFADGAMELLRGLGLSLNDALPQDKGFNFSDSALARYLSALFYLSARNRADFAFYCGGAFIDRKATNRYGGSFCLFAHNNDAGFFRRVCLSFARLFLRLTPGVDVGNYYRGHFIRKRNQVFNGSDVGGRSRLCQQQSHFHSIAVFIYRNRRNARAVESGRKPPVVFTKWEHFIKRHRFFVTITFIVIIAQG